MMSLYVRNAIPSLGKFSRSTFPPLLTEKSDSLNPANAAYTSLLSKVVESIKNIQFLVYLKDQQLINDSQYGFRDGHSTGGFESKGEDVTVSLDMVKASDYVWYGAFLSFYGLPENLCKWVSSFLIGYSIKLAVDGFCSDHVLVNAASKCCFS